MDLAVTDDPTLSCPFAHGRVLPVSGCRLRAPRPATHEHLEQTLKTSPRLVAALAAATLLLSACGSDDTADTSTSAPAPAASSEAEQTPVDSADEESTSEDPGMSESTSEESTSESDPSGESGAESSEPTRIIGGDVDSLDEQSAAWFSGMCDGLAPMLAASDTLQTITTDPASAAGVIEELGTGLVSSSETLAALPAPTFDGGEELAQSVISGFAQIGEKFQTASAQFAANDPAALTTINEALEANPLAELDGAKMNPELQDDFRALPACAPLSNN